MLSKRQRYVIERMREGWWLRSNIDFVHVGSGPDDTVERVLMNTFISLIDRELIRHNGIRKNGRSFWELTPAGLKEAASLEST